VRWVKPKVNRKFILQLNRDLPFWNITVFCFFVSRKSSGITPVFNSAAYKRFTPPTIKPYLIYWLIKLFYPSSGNVSVISCTANGFAVVRHPPITHHIML
jgi:hypothetical protein